MYRDLDRRYIEYRFDRIEQMLVQLGADMTALKEMEEAQMAGIADVKTAVEDERTVVESAVALLDGLNQKLSAALASNDPAAVQAVLDEINANKTSLADAVARNTAAADEAHAAGM